MNLDIKNFFMADNNDNKKPPKILKDLVQTDLMIILIGRKYSRWFSDGVL